MIPYSLSSRTLAISAASLLASLFTVPVTCPAADIAPKPNIIVIFADDLGIGDMGAYGSKDIKTPNLDRLAGNGVLFEQGYVTAPQCAPSRAGLICGRYQQRSGFEFNFPVRDADHLGLSLEETTLATRLKQAGYTTGIVGKWHLGTGDGYLPLQRGFDSFYGLGNGSSYYRPPYRWATEYLDIDRPSDIYRDNECIIEEADYLTDAFSREAVSFIKRNSAGPFFLYLPYTAPHVPLQATQKYLDRVEGIEDPDRRIYAAMVYAMDDGVGQILDALEDEVISEDTLVFFLSDNGADPKHGGGSNAPFRGVKGNFYEGGIRVPFIAQWPGKIPAGEIYPNPVSALDIAATAVALAGSEADAQPALEGVNLMPFITGRTTSLPHDSLCYKLYAWNKLWGIRQGDWMLLGFDGPSGRSELYNIAQDPLQKKNLAKQEPQRVRAMTELWKQWDAHNQPSAWAYQSSH
ncbi:MAG: sulfatase-like hydrolase/transferase [Verrucomicrobiota bacterium JB024]|nr:sulfatase-like hydrolase/transferase [Verrucomicrobiota bacterium JB024]